MMALSQPNTRNYGKHYFRCLVLFILFGVYLEGPAVSFAKEVVLTSGEKFTSSKVWSTSDKIRFNMHGLVVTVNRSDVSAIISDDGTRQQIAAFPPQDQIVRSPSPTQPVAPPKVPPKEQPLTIQQPPSVLQPEPVQRPPVSVKTDAIGLDGIKWLMTPADISGLKLIEKDAATDGIDQYWRPAEKMQLGDALVDGIVYGFWRNRLHSIMMWVEGQPGYKRLGKAVFSRYGEGRKSRKVAGRTLWLDPSTDRMLEFDQARNTGFFWMRSRKLDVRIKALNPAK